VTPTDQNTLAYHGTELFTPLKVSERYLKNEKHLDLIKRDTQMFSIWTKLKEAGPLIIFCK